MSIRSGVFGPDLSLDNVVDRPYDRKLIAFDATLDGNGYTTISFDPLRDLVAMRVMRSEVPATAYLDLNGYKFLVTGNSATTDLFARLPAGQTEFPTSGADITSEPYTFVFDPILPTLTKINAGFVAADGTPLSGNVALELAVYMKKKKFTRA